jgi:hypothetical protein
VLAFFFTANSQNYKTVHFIAQLRTSRARTIAIRLASLLQSALVDEGLDQLLFLIYLYLLHDVNSSDAHVVPKKLNCKLATKHQNVHQHPSQQPAPFIPIQSQYKGCIYVIG